MGTTLTGTTPQDTYDSLIKVTDNGPLSGTAKYLSDGLGNDSVLALSTSAVAIGTTTAAGKLNIKGSAGSGLNLTHSNNTVVAELVEFSGAQGAGLTLKNAAGTTNVLFNAGGESYINGGNVGIGTSTPEAKLDIKGEAAAGSVGMFIENAAASTTSNSADIYFGTWGGSTVAGITNARISAVNTLGVDARTDLDFYTYDGAASGKRVSITSGGVLSLTQGQIKFPATQVPSADANTLDDYEEGTWSPQVYYQNATDQSNSTNVTQVGTYTKIGRQVKLCGVLQWTITGSPAVDNMGIKNLPFTAQNSADYFSFGQLQLINADSYPAATLDIFINQNATVAIIATPAGISNQGANIGTSGTKTARFEITYFV